MQKYFADRNSDLLIGVKNHFLLTKILIETNQVLKMNRFLQKSNVQFWNVLKKGKNQIFNIIIGFRPPLKMIEKCDISFSPKTVQIKPIKIIITKKQQQNTKISFQFENFSGSIE